jgi:L-threo-3-deoxy-hexylosonate aldolase
MSAPYKDLTLPAGVYVPIVTIFDPKTEDLDLETQKKHTLRMAKDGIVGIVVMGSNGEAVHLSHQERIDVVKATREVLDENDFKKVPVIAGCTAQSTRESIQMCKDAAAAGASAALILAPCYFKPAMSEEVIYQFFAEIADKSPIGILMYNYPGAVAGIDMSSDLMIRIAKHPNCVGAKFTCGQTGKLNRVAAAIDAVSTTSQGSGFLATGGLADMTLPAAMSNGSGVIVGSANVFPKLCVKVWDLAAAGKFEEAQKAQTLLAAMDWELAKSVVPATKATLEHYFGYGGVPRRPYPALKGEQAQAFVKAIKPAMDFEEKN